MILNSGRPEIELEMARDIGPFAMETAWRNSRVSEAGGGRGTGVEPSPCWPNVEVGNPAYAAAPAARVLRFPAHKARLEARNWCVGLGHVPAHGDLHQFGIA